MHVLTIDVRGHGANNAEVLPMSVGEYALDTRAAVAALRARPEVTTVGILGHSMGAAGSLVATAQDPDVDAVIAVAAPADPHRLTRQTFRLAKLPIPDVLAWPLAWLTTRVYLQPRGHSVASISASNAVRAIRVPVMLVHGTEDGVVPVGDLARLVAARRETRPDAVTESLEVLGGRHSWLYEFPEYRAAIGRFLARELGGPLTPDEAARIAEAVPAVRLPDPERLVTLDEEPGGLRSLARIVRRNETAAPTPVNRIPRVPAAQRCPDPSSPWRPPSHEHRLGRDPRQASRPRLRRPADRGGRARPDPCRRPPGAQLEESAALGVHRRARPGAAARHVHPRPVLRSHRRRGDRDRLGDAGSVTRRASRCP